MTVHGLCGWAALRWGRRHALSVRAAEEEEQQKEFAERQ
eukprot:gene16428-1723_t